MISNDFINIVIDLYNNGLNNREIAKRLNKASSSVSYYLKKADLKNRQVQQQEANAIKLDNQKATIMELYNNGKTQKEIAKQLGISVERLHKFYEKNGLIAKGNSKYLTNSGFENFLFRLNEYNSKYEYVDGYINDESKVKLRCKDCGNIIERWASAVRHPAQFRCFECERIKTEKIKQKQKDERQEQERIRKANKLLDSVQLSFLICKNCGTLFVPTGNRTKFCSTKCCQRYGDQQKSKARIERAKQNGDVDYSITLEKLIKRDNCKCWLCGIDCNLNDFIIVGEQKIAGNYYPSIDHVVPLAKGGTHSWDNVRLAHRICNSIKSDKINFENNSPASF